MGRARPRGLRFSCGHRLTFLGSATVRLIESGRTVVFSGDLGRANHPLLGAAGAPDGADVVAVDRTEVVLFLLPELMQAGGIPRLPVYVNSSMALRALGVTVQPYASSALQAAVEDRLATSRTRFQPVSPPGHDPIFVDGGFRDRGMGIHGRRPSRSLAWWAWSRPSSQTDIARVSDAERITSSGPGE